MASSVDDRPKLHNDALQREIMQLRQVDNHSNLLFLAFEYLSLFLVIASAVVFAEHRAAWSLSWYWNLPVFAIAIVLVGAIQHRLAGLGHESSHYSFVKNRYLNDLIPDFFCMFPLFTTIHFYRLFHMGHHQFTNDPERDPDLQNLGHAKRAAEFPMDRQRFIRVIYFCFLVAPVRFVRYQWAYFTVNTLVFKSLTGLGRPQWLMPTALAGIGLLGLVIPRLPDWAVFQSPFRQAYSPRVGAFLRMTYYTLLLLGLAYLRVYTGGRSAIYPVLLWLVPLQTTFMFFMFLRDVYQHSNADDGRLTNSRVFFTDPFTRWAVFVYGQDMHIPHHLFPAVPHYRLRKLHQILKWMHPDYGVEVVETHGTFHDVQGRRTILDEMTRTRIQLSGADAPVQ
jgi:fatty acid desaturase